MFKIRVLAGYENVNPSVGQFYLPFRIYTMRERVSVAFPKRDADTLTRSTKLVHAEKKNVKFIKSTRAKKLHSWIRCFRYCYPNDANIRYFDEYVGQLTGIVFTLEIKNRKFNFFLSGGRNCALAITLQT